ncbi:MULTISPECIES: hypothetical protein [Aurantimonas]
MVAVPHRAQPYSLKRGGDPVLFDTFGAARRAAYEHIVDGLLNSKMYAESYERKLTEHEKLQADVFGAARVRDEITPESAFGVIYARGKKGNSRQVVVERKRRRAKA